jgi:hypothetical protein
MKSPFYHFKFIKFQPFISLLDCSDYIIFKNPAFKILILDFIKVIKGLESHIKNQMLSISYTKNLARMKKLLALISVFIVLMDLPVSSAMANEYIVLARPLNLLGYVTQGGAFSLNDKNNYGTEKGLQSALMNLFVEGDYKISSELKFYGSSMLTVDWAYQLNADRESWHEKLFSKSKDHLNVDNKYWQVLKEAHLTWTPGNFMFRIGKQIVSWGEMDGIRLMDQINPLDQRRGFADVEFETTIIPIWLIRANYSLPVHLGWLQDLGFEFIFNPNADFIPNQPIRSGNDEGGIWAPNILIPGPFPFGEAHLGSTILNVKEPRRFNSNGFEYAFRVKCIVYDSIITLNYFYGLDNDPVAKSAGPPIITQASDGKLIIHPFLQGKYPLFRFIGATFSKDITPLKSALLGGVSPVVRFETLYAFKNIFVTTINTFDKSDEFRWAIGIDWKIKIPLLNPRAYFSVSPQFFHRKIMDYPSRYDLADLEKNTYAVTLLIKTSYFNAKLVPSFFWLRDITSQSDFFKLELLYDYTHNWRFTLGTLLFHGEEKGKGYQRFDNKDQIYFKITYRWS